MIGLEDGSPSRVQRGRRYVAEVVRYLRGQGLDVTAQHMSGSKIRGLPTLAIETTGSRTAAISSGLARAQAAAGDSGTRIPVVIQHHRTEGGTVAEDYAVMTVSSLVALVARAWPELQHPESLPAEPEHRRGLRTCPCGITFPAEANQKYHDVECRRRHQRARQRAA